MRFLVFLILFNTLAYAHNFAGSGGLQIAFYTNPDAMIPEPGQRLDLIFEAYDDKDVKLGNMDYDINVTKDSVIVHNQKFYDVERAEFPFTFETGNYIFTARVSHSQNYKGEMFPPISANFLADVGKDKAMTKGKVIVEVHPFEKYLVMAYFAFTVLIVAVGIALVLKSPKK